MVQYWNHIHQSHSYDWDLQSLEEAQAHPTTYCISRFVPDSGDPLLLQRTLELDDPSVTLAVCRSDPVLYVTVNTENSALLEAFHAKVLENRFLPLVVAPYSRWYAEKMAQDVYYAAQQQEATDSSSSDDDAAVAFDMTPTQPIRSRQNQKSARRSPLNPETRSIKQRIQ